VDVGVRRGVVDATRGTFERGAKEATGAAGSESGWITIVSAGVVIALGAG
jgi:hypothetical protein